VLEQIGGIVLAGGKSSRMGRDKTQLAVDGSRTFVERAVATVSRLADEVIVVTAAEPYEQAGVRWARDIYPGAGPLGGIYSGLRAGSMPYVLVVACDMPFLSMPLLRHMVQMPRDYDVLIPRREDGRLEPLHAIYARACLEPIHALLEAGRYCILDLFEMGRMHYLDEEELRRYDPQGRSFFNINTPDELWQARQMAARAEGGKPDASRARSTANRCAS